MPVPPRPYEEPRRSAALLSGGGPRGQPLDLILREACLAAHLELDHLCRPRRRGTRRLPDQMQQHLVSSLCVGGRAPACALRSESEACEVGDQLRRRGVEAHDELLQIVHRVPPFVAVSRSSASAAVALSRCECPPSTPSVGVDAAARMHRSSSAMTRTALTPNDLVHATRLPFDPGSPRTASYVEERWSPALVRLSRNRQAKADAYSALNYRPRNAQRTFLSQAGPRLFSGLLKLGIILFLSGRLAEKQRGRPSRVALARARIRLET
jgi:hypothetical protein